MKQLGLITLLLAAALAYSQEQRFTIKEYGTLQVLSPVDIYNQQGRLVATANKKGTFVLKASYGDRFEAVKPGYLVKSFEVNWDSTSAEANTLNLLMVKSSLDLKAVEITASKINFRDTTKIIDFELLENAMLFITYNQLVLTDTLENPLLATPNNINATGIKKDPRGYVFLLSADSAYQVYTQDAKLYFYPAFNITSYNTYIAPLAAEWQGSLIMRNQNPVVYPLPVSEFRPGNRGKALSHPPFHNKGVQLLVYKLNEPPRLLYNAVDSLAYKIAQDAFMEYYGIAARIERKFDANKYNHRDLFKLDLAKKTYQNFYARAVSFPVIKIDTGLLVFNHLNGEVVFLDSTLNIHATYSFNYPKKPLEPFLVQDEITGTLYIIDNKNGLRTLAEIHNWQTGATTKLDLFAKEIKVKNGRAYFINEEKRFRTLSL